MKICPVGAELFHVDRWTDMTKLTAAFHNSANAPKMTFNIHTFTCTVTPKIPSNNKLTSHSAFFKQLADGIYTATISTSLEPSSVATCKTFFTLTVSVFSCKIKSKQ